MQSETKEGLITLRLSSLLEDLLGDLDCTPLHYENAKMIELATSKNTNIIIQWNDLNTNKQLDKPILWSKRAWDTTYKVWLNKKKQSERERKISNLNTENIQRIARWLSNKTKLPYEEAIETAKLMFHRNMANKDNSLFKELGVTIEEYKDEQTS